MTKEALDLLDTLVTQASSDNVAYLRDPLAKVFAIYYEKLLNRPASELLDFVLLIKNQDSKLTERFGMEFLQEFVTRLIKLACSDKLDEFPWIPTIVSEFGKMLGADPALLSARDQGGSLFIGLNEAAKQARSQLRVMGLQQPEQMEEISDLPPVDSNSSNSSNSSNIPVNADEELALLLAREEEEKAELDRGIQGAKLSAQRLKQVEENPTVTTTSLSEKDLTVSEKGSIETKEPDVKASVTTTLTKHN